LVIEKIASIRKLFFCGEGIVKVSKKKIKNP
jgi:hypothetical protein